MICYKKIGEKCTGDVVYPFVEFELFPCVQVSSTDLYISAIRTPYRCIC